MNKLNIHLKYWIIENKIIFLINIFIIICYSLLLWLRIIQDLNMLIVSTRE